jgi:hypothetical protein
MRKEATIMWKKYAVDLRFTTPFASSTPKNPKDIEAMLIARAPSEAEIRKRKDAGEEIVPLGDLGEQVAEEVKASEEVERGYATFKRDDKGLYYEARCVKAHIKDCANQLQGFLETKALKSKVANRVYVEPAKIYLGKSEPDGSEVRIVHAMTMKGPRSSLKTIDFVDSPVLKFRLKLLDDGVVDEEILKAIFEYGGEHGMGQERSQDWGKYKLEKLEEAK